MTVSGAELVKFPQGPASWTVDVSPVAHIVSGTLTVSRPDNAAVTKVEIRQDAARRRSLVTYASGKTRQTWSLAGAAKIVTEAPNGRAFLAANQGLFAVPFSEQDFDWLSPAYLQEPNPVAYRDQPCWYYRLRVQLPRENDEPADRDTWVEREAWIDSVTLRPVALSNSGALGVFTFDKTPSGAMPSPPPQFEKLLRAYEQADQ